MKLKYVLVFGISLCCLVWPLQARTDNSFVLSEHGKTEYRIAITGSASEVEQFAAQELRNYLKQMTGATFDIIKGIPSGKVIRIGLEPSIPERADASLKFDGYLIKAEPGRILLAGTDERATLFAVYGFLEQLGCRWFAPNYDFYGAAKGEVVPQTDTLRVPSLSKIVHPRMKYRSKDVGEGWTHNVQTLRQLIDWMPKVNLNVLKCPINQFGEGKVVWDNWRSDLLPEIQKRGLLLEVGQHGYDNFLPVKLYFDKHPEWFGMVEGKRSTDSSVVFETANAAAMAEFVHNVEAYLASHPEINVFDLWPPDSSRWSQSLESRKLGDPSSRHVLVVNAVAKMIKSKFPQVKLEFLAYDNYLHPPKGIKFPDDTILDFAPFARSYRAPIWDEQNKVNREYSEALHQWLDKSTFPGDVLIYTYYTKYLWRSLPMVIPVLIAKEASYYAALGINGLGSYSEPGNWFTYELNHYILAKLQVDPHLDAEELLADYCKRRFPMAWHPVLQYFDVIEKTVPSVGKIPYTTGATTEEKLEEGARRLDHASALLETADHLSMGSESSILVKRLEASLQYAVNDVRIRQLAWRMSQGSGEEEESIEMIRLLRERRDLFLAHQGEGLFLVPTPYTNYGFSPEVKF